MGTGLVQAMRTAPLQAAIGSKTGPIRPPQIASQSLGADLHERGMKLIARRRLQEQLHEELKAEEEMRHCSFSPDLSPSRPSAGNQNRTSVSPRRALEFYGEQLLWQESSPCPPADVRRPVRGILPRTAYDRQMLWMLQRDYELQELRQARCEEAARRSSASAAPRLPRAESRSVPATPRSSFASLRDMGNLPPQSSPVGKSAANAGLAIVELLRRSRSAPSTPRSGAWKRPGNRPPSTAKEALTAAAAVLDHTADFGWPLAQEEFLR